MCSENTQFFFKKEEFEKIMAWHSACFSVIIHSLENQFLTSPLFPLGS